MDNEFNRADYVRLKKALENMNAIFIAIRDGSLSLTHDSNDFNVLDHVYDERVILGILETYVCEALELKHPVGNPIGWDKPHNNT